MEKRKLSFWEIWNMSFGFLGIQFGFALQGGFMSRIFQTLGAEKDEIPMLVNGTPNPVKGINRQFPKNVMINCPSVASDSKHANMYKNRS